MSSPVEVVSNSCSLISTLLSSSSNSVNTLPFKCVMNTEGMATSSEPLPLIERGCDKFSGISLLSVRPTSVANVDYITNNFHMCMHMCLYIYMDMHAQTHMHIDTHTHAHTHTHTHTHTRTHIPTIHHIIQRPNELIQRKQVISLFTLQRL